MTNCPSPLGNLIAQHEDDEGLITIYQKHNLRYLTFGNHTEQSCLTIDRPYRLEHVYTQAMMLSLLLKKDIRSVLLLGLGGGSLARALRHSRDKLKIDAIEYRQSVIDMAKRYFDLPDDPAFNILCKDARQYIESTAKSFDLIFADLYLPEGMDEAQLNDEFLGNCSQCLEGNGILVINFWSNDFHQTLLGQQALSRVFGDRVLNSHVHGGNNIAFAFRDDIPDLEKKSFFQAAQQLGLKLDIPLQRLARNFWQQNAVALQTQKYRRS
jgi:spermidine synthase